MCGLQDMDKALVQAAAVPQVLGAPEVLDRAAQVEGGVNHSQGGVHLRPPCSHISGRLLLSAWIPRQCTPREHQPVGRGGGSRHLLPPPPVDQVPELQRRPIEVAEYGRCDLLVVSLPRKLRLPPPPPRLEGV